MPTAPSTDSAHLRSSSVAVLPPVIAEAPFPTSAGVFGMHRTTATPSPAESSMVAMLIPAAIDNSRVAPAATAAAVAARTSDGLTAITAERHEGIVSTTATLGNMSLSSRRRGLSNSTTANLSGANTPDSIIPPTRAAPMLPPPTMTTSITSMASADLVAGWASFISPKLPGTYRAGTRDRRPEVSLRYSDSEQQPGP